MNESDNKQGFSLSDISKFRNELFGISILMIMFFHFCGPHVSHFIDNNPGSLVLIFERRFEKYIGSIGVEVFVFLSGMGLYYSFSKNSEIRSFYRRRYRRILIPYLYVGTAFWAIKDILILKEGFVEFLRDLSFYSLVTDGTHTIWFIVFLIIVYFMFPFAYKIVFNQNSCRTVVFAALLSVLGLAPIALRMVNEDLYSNTQIVITRIPLFFIGMYTGKFIKDNRRIPHIFVVVFIVLATLLQYYSKREGLISYQNRYIAALFGMAVIAVLVYILQLIESWKVTRAVLCFFGRYSLELYLLHVTLRNLMNTIKLQPYISIRYVIMVVISICLSILLKRLSAHHTA